VEILLYVWVMFCSFINVNLGVWFVNVSPLSEFRVCHRVWCGSVLIKTAPIDLKSEYRIPIACNGKITTQYPINQRIVVGELVASYFY
jgi:hypothetical protein